MVDQGKATERALVIKDYVKGFMEVADEVPDKPSDEETESSAELENVDIYLCLL